MSKSRFVLLTIAVLYAGLGGAARIELPIPPSAEEKQSRDGLWPALVASLAGTGAGGKVVLFPLEGPRDQATLFQASTPGQDPENAEESLRVVRHNKANGDERAESAQLFNDLSMLCRNFPVRMVKMPNGTVLVEHESTNCIKRGYRVTVSRFLKGADGQMYQAVYLARRNRPSDSSLELWRNRLAEAKVAP